MRHIRVQFFLTLGALGTVMPYMSVFFRHAGLNAAQVGNAYAIWSLTAVFGPIVLTMLADTRLDPRRLLAIASAVTALALLLLTQVHGVAAVMGVWTIYCAASMPIFPLQDGVHFALQRRVRECGSPPTPYHLVRVWGTIGFLTPSLISLFILRDGVSLGVVLGIGAAFSAFAAVQALLLPDPRPSRPEPARADADAYPTLRAARAMLHPQLFVFCIAVVLVQMVAAVHSAFYPIYLSEHVHLADQWLGAASNVAVVIEIGLTFACGWLLRGMGVKGLVLLGMLATALRMLLIARSDSPYIAVSSQALHGLMILATGVVPHTVLDSHADDRFRHSMQGILVMIVSGGQAIASHLAGRMVATSLSNLFIYCAALCLMAALLVALFFREPQTPLPKTDPADAFVPEAPLEMV